MGIPIHSIKDRAKQFPIKPLTVFALAKSNIKDIESQYNSIINKAPYSLLPIDYIFVPIKPSINIKPSNKSVNNIIHELQDYNFITRDVEIEEYFMTNPIANPVDFSICYLCGKIDSFLGLELSLSIITYELLSHIRNLAEKLVHPALSKILDYSKIYRTAAENILRHIKEAMKILGKESNIDLKPQIENIREWLNETNIIRTLPNELSIKDSIDTFTSTKVNCQTYKIVVRKIDKSYRYQIVLIIGDQEFAIDSKTQSVQLYLYVIAYKYRDNHLEKKLFTNEISKSKRRKELSLLNDCYRAITGISEVNLKATVDKEELHIEELSNDFKKAYSSYTFDKNGERNTHKLENLISRTNRIVISKLLTDFPEEIKDIFRIHYDSKIKAYTLKIPKDNIIIE